MKALYIFCLAHSIARIVGSTQAESIILFSLILGRLDFLLAIYKFLLFYFDFSFNNGLRTNYKVSWCLHDSPFKDLLNRIARCVHNPKPIFCPGLNLSESQNIL